LNLSKGKGWQRARTMLPIFIAMMISVLRASDHVARALEARGFGTPSTARTSLYDLQATARDYTFTIMLVITLVAFLLLNLYFGFASQTIALF
jgi:energy-coupling factor transporter transmembrane protein EcfT